MLILGLGNPGQEYAGTRHNVGYSVVEELARRHGIALDRSRHRARFGKGVMGGRPVLLAEPLTFMNASGEAARPLLSYHGLTIDDLVVVHDEADLAPGTVRVKSGGGIAGHKGLASLVAHLGSREFVRVRLGIGRPVKGGTEMARHVLTRPGREDAELLRESIDEGADAVEMIVEEGVEAAMRRFNRRDAAGAED